MTKKTFNVTGMTCAACSARVEKSVSKTSGVDKVSVNLLTNSMEVIYDENTLTPKEIISAVEKAGYAAVVKGNKKKSASASQEENGSIFESEAKALKNRLIYSAIFLIPLFYISMGHMLGLPLPPFLHGKGNETAFAFTQFLLTVPIVFINISYFKNGFKNLCRLSPNMDSLIAIGSSAAIVYGIFAVYRIGWGYGHGDYETVAKYSMDLYFESAGTILTLITLGKLLESRAKRKTTDAISSLVRLQPKTAFVIRNGAVEEIPVENVQYGDTVSVKQGSTIPVDGVIVGGSCTVDASAITGESIPVEKNIGDKVTGATINTSGYIEIKATGIGEESTLSSIIRLVEEASASKAPVARAADKISGVFVPVVICIAVLAAFVWFILGKDLEFSLSIGIAVLVISCPCALGLATPTAIMTGTGRGAQMGILIKSAEALEKAGKTDTVVLDKTGTLTEGKPKVTDIIVLSGTEKELTDIAVSVESLSEHPLAKAIAEYGKEKGFSEKAVSNFKSYGGMGISAEAGGDFILAGNIRLMNTNGINSDSVKKITDRLANEGKTPLLFAKNGIMLGIIALADTVKESSKTAVRELFDMGIDVAMLTGDNKATANAIGKTCGIEKIESEVMPQDKEAYIRKLQDSGHKVTMVGDGINDAPALAKADTGVAIGAGTDIAVDSADVVLVRSDLNDVVRLIKLSRKTLKNIKENLFWALLYNSLGIPLAAGVFYGISGWKLNPMYGAAAMCVSSVCVVSNALRLRKYTPKLKYSVSENKNISDKHVNNDTALSEEEQIVKVENSMTKKVVIDGMMCTHCSGRVEKALNAVPGASASVDLESKTATVSGDITDEAIINAVTEAGYTVLEIK